MQCFHPIADFGPLWIFCVFLGSLEISHLKLQSNVHSRPGKTVMSSNVVCLNFAWHMCLTNTYWINELTNQFTAWLYTLNSLFLNMTFNCVLVKTQKLGQYKRAKQYYSITRMGKFSKFLSLTPTSPKICLIYLSLEKLWVCSQKSISQIQCFLWTKYVKMNLLITISMRRDQWIHFPRKYQ